MLITRLYKLFTNMLPYLAVVWLVNFVFISKLDYNYNLARDYKKLQ